ncbi:MAG: hypothetical protein AAFY06_05965 [Pseudomonadota bacterium]
MLSTDVGKRFSTINSHLLLSCHIGVNIRALTKGAGYPGEKCANQQLTARSLFGPLGLRFRSVSVAPYGKNAVRDKMERPSSINGLDGSKETVMSNTLKALLALGLFTVVAACAQQEEPVEEPIIIEEPVSEKF